MLNLRNKNTLLKQKGFNLLELLVVLGLLAITLGVFIPSGQNMLKKSRLISTTNQVYSALLFTRNEATRLKTPAKLCFIQTETATNCTDEVTNLLGIFVKNLSDDNLTLKKSIVITEQATVVFKGVLGNYIEFYNLGNRQASISNAAVFLEVTVENIKRQVEICFNGRNQIRKKLNLSECK
ncbi:MAG: prepilin-type N-terminal cleavage/methylation domain-containing protein [Pseudomonadaceae bacterium]|nr:prepilin-type N-terminal cleavage/methylation domain-containing protein [Pseudomonadaceae bacterium]